MRTWIHCLLGRGNGILFVILISLLISREGRGFESLPSLLGHPTLKGLDYFEEREDGAKLTCQAESFQVNPYLGIGNLKKPRIILYLPHPFRSRRVTMKGEVGKIKFSAGAVLLKGAVSFQVDDVLSLETDQLSYFFKKESLSTFAPVRLNAKGNLREGKNLLIDLKKDHLYLFSPISSSARPPQVFRQSIH